MRSKPLAVNRLFWLFLALVSVCSMQPGWAQQTVRERLRQRLQQSKQEQPNDPGIVQTNIAGLDVVIWKPVPKSAGAASPLDSSSGSASPNFSAAAVNTNPVPLVIFSHGYRGTPMQSRFIMEALAQAGYLVIAPKHRDALDAGHLDEKLAVGFGQPAQWNKDSCSYRFEDVRTLLDALHKDPQWQASIDWSRVGLAGHSLGGYTVLGLAGAWPEWKTAGIKAILAMSPYCEPFVANGDLRDLGVPVMYQGGTKDFGVTPSVKRPGGAFSKTSAPVYFVDFENAHHFSWTNLNQDASQTALINYYCVAFFNKYVNGDLTAKPEVQLPGVDDLEVK